MEILQGLFKSLAPWPMAQGILIGLCIASAGFWAMRRGLQDHRSNEPDIEELKADWESRKHLAHVHENSFEIVKLLEDIKAGQSVQTAALNRAADMMFNRHQ